MNRFLVIFVISFSLKLLSMDPPIEQQPSSPKSSRDTETMEGVVIGSRI